MKVDRFDNGDEYWTVESMQDLRGWVIMHEEPWKENVVRLHLRRPLSWAINRMEFRQVYCSVDILRPVVQVGAIQ